MDAFGCSLIEARSRLAEIVRRESIERGDFVLSSGRRSSYYIDMRRTTTHPEGAALSARLLIDALADVDVERVGGPTLGADPIVGALAAVSAGTSRPLPVFIVRKEPKTHGTGLAIEGQFRPGARVAVLDDTLTSGGSLLRAVEAVREAGGEVVRVLALVDREEGGAQRIAEAGYAFRAIYTVAEILGDALDDARSPA